MQLYTIYTTLCIAYDFARILSASTCIGYAPTRIYMHISYALYVIHIWYTCVMFASTWIIYASTCINKQLHALYTNLHVLHAYAVKCTTYATTCLLFMWHANMYNICTYTYYAFIIHTFDALHDTSRYSYRYTIICNT